MKKKKIVTGSLIRYPLENINRDSFETIGRELKEILDKQPGIYALYNDDRLVRVGLTRGLHGRLSGYLKAKYKWNKFSIFIIRNIRYLKDLETTILRILMPMRNKQKGRVHHQEEQYLKRLLKEKVNKKKQNLRGKVRKKEKETRLIQKIIKQKVRKKEEETRLIQKEITQIERAIYSR